MTKFDDVMWSRFWVIPKITSANLCRSIHGIIDYSTSICPFESGKCGKEVKKLQKFEYLKNKKSFLDEIKNILIVFEGLSFDEKIKNWWKIADTSFKGVSLVPINVIIFIVQKWRQTSEWLDFVRQACFRTIACQFKIW